MNFRVDLRDLASRLRIVAWLAGCLAGSSVVNAADMSAREVTALLFRANPDAQIELTEKDLSRLDLSGLDFKRARLSGTNLFGADLTDSNLQGADLSGAVLDRATVTISIVQRFCGQTSIRRLSHLLKSARTLLALR